MDQERKKIPAEAVELYTRFIHGEVSRRAFLDGLKHYAVAGLTVTALIDALMPNYAAAQQISKTDERIKASYETIPSPKGNGSIKGYLGAAGQRRYPRGDPGKTARHHHHS